MLEVRLTGGEPTLHPDFFELARAVRANGMALSVNSNLLAERATLRRLVELRPDLLITSLDAAPEAHLANRGEGFGTIADNVQHLRASLLASCRNRPGTLPGIMPA